MAEYIVTVEEDARNFEKMFIGAIRSYPKLIRCKDCKHFMNDDEIVMDDDGFYYNTCPYMGEASEEDFCSKAERKEE